MPDPTISWISQTEAFNRSVREGKLVSRTTGGLEYNFNAYSVLRQHFDIRTEESFERRKGESIPVYGGRIISKKCSSDVIIKEPMVFTLGSRSRKARELGMLHHIDFLRKKSRLKDKAYFSLLEYKLRTLDHVVTVSEYWRDYVLEKGAKAATVIYNSFDSGDFERSEADQDELRERLGLKRSSPVIYLGKATREKGLYRAARLLAGTDAQLVASGQIPEIPPENVQVFDLSAQDYITMLHLADLCITMPLFPEGWSRVAHQSLLCRTPVIGVPSGGMTELLQKSGQRILDKDEALPDVVSEVLDDAATYSESGYRFASGLNQDYFSKAWTDLINSIRR